MAAKAFGIVYKTINLVNEKIYIGQTVKKKKSYLGSGVYFTRAFNKYGRKNFKREILCLCSNRKELDLKEKYWIDYYRNVGIDNMYNITDGGNSFSGYIRPEELNKKHSEDMKGKNNPNYGKKFSEEHKRKMSEAKKGIKLTEEHKRKTGLASKGRKHSEETKKKISESRMGKMTGKNNGMYGVHRTGKDNPNTKLTEKQVIQIRNIKGKTQKEIAKMYNVSRGCITGIIYRRTWNHI